MIELTEKQINQIARSISVLAIKTYIEQNREAFENFLKEEKHKSEHLT